MRTLQKAEISQVAGGGLLGLDLGVDLLDVLGINAHVGVGNDRHDHGRGDCGRGHGRRHRRGCY